MVIKLYCHAIAKLAGRWGQKTTDLKRAMKKDKIYSLRMNSKVRDALQRASNKEQRSVASLLHKIIMDFLTREGFLSDADYGVERRQFNHKKITVTTETTFTED